MEKPYAALIDLLPYMQLPPTESPFHLSPLPPFQLQPMFITSM